jgi:hypothetical protein
MLTIPVCSTQRRPNSGPVRVGAQIGGVEDRLFQRGIHAWPGAEFVLDLIALEHQLRDGRWSLETLLVTSHGDPGIVRAIDSLGGDPHQMI